METYTKEEVIKMVLEFATTYNTEAIGFDYMTDEEKAAEVEEKIIWPENKLCSS